MSLTSSQAATLLQVTNTMVCTMCRTGKIPATKDNSGRWIIQNRDLSEYLLKKALRVSVVAGKKGLHPETLRRWLRENKLAGTKEGMWIVDALAPLPPHRKSSSRKKR